ncbi:O-antigen ligase family protein [Paenibacillus pedocola]|uniref:O-antigen ligase family protein n=1 Tax=Paenibacillus pedocola TaxID=3242193 RepID=UPI00287772EA|nr:O-antigen ligase family protein [Paenibacillus typhae]
MNLLNSNDTYKNQFNFLRLSSSILLGCMPFFPLIKEWSLNLGNMLEIIFILLLFIALIRTIATNNTKFIINVVILYSAIITILVLFTLGSKDIIDSISALRLYIEPLIISLSIIILSKYSWTDAFKILKLSLLVLLTISSLAIVQFVYPKLIVNIHSPDYYSILRWKTDFIAFSNYNRSISVFNDPNVLALYLLISLPSIFLFDKIRKIGNLKKYLFVLLVIAAIILTNSRQALVILLFYFVIFLIKNFKGNMFLISFASGGILVNILYILGKNEIRERIFDWLRFRNDTVGLNGRSEDWTYFFNNIDKSIFFGNGLNTGRSISMENSYLLLVSQIGVIGLILLFILFAGFIFILTSYNYPINGYAIYPLIAFVLSCIVGDYILISVISSIAIFLVLFGYKRDEEVFN